MSETAVKIKNVKKTFHLPHENHDSIKSKILSSFKKKEKGYDKYEALKGIDIDIKKGEFIGILGRNGAGKSTLLKIIAEIYRPTAGSIKVKGKLIPFIELGVGFNKNLSGRDNVYLNGAMLGFSRPEINKMYDSIVEFAELEKFMDQKLKNYSSGMKVRLAFSIAIKADADILLLDEVLAVGDAAFKRKCYDYFNTLKQNKKTIIFVTHNMSAVRDYCDRAVLVQDGKVTFDGSPEEATGRYLDMFNTAKESKEKSKDVTLDDVTVKKTDEKLIFRASISSQTEEPINDLILKIAIKKQNGRVVAGFSNKNIRQVFDIHLLPGQTSLFEFESPNLIGSGNYVVGASLTGIGNVDLSDEDEDDTVSAVVYDSDANITHFSVKRENSNASVLLPATLKISEEG